MKDKKSGISLCIIAKNEESNLEECIKSADGVFEQLVIIDTGSTDGTLDIAKKYTQDVHCTTWFGDFSYVRNFAIEKSGHEWILFLDADERLVSGHEKIKSAAQSTNKVAGYFIDFFNVDCKSAIIPGHQRLLRLFRNNPDYRYLKMVHETISHNIKFAGGKTTDLEGALIHHHGYKDNLLKQKLERNLEILQNFVMIHRTDPHTHLKLGETMFSLGMTEEATKHLGYASKSADLNNISRNIALEANIRLSELLANEGNYVEALDYAKKALEIDTQNASCKYTVAICMLQLGNVEDAKKILTSLKAEANDDNTSREISQILKALSV